MKRLLTIALCLAAALPALMVSAYICPDQSIKEFPPHLWPYIRPVAILDLVQYEAIVVQDSNPLPAHEMEVLLNNMTGAQGFQFAQLLRTSKYDFDRVLRLMDEQLGIEYQMAAMQFGALGTLSEGRASSLLKLYFTQLDVCNTCFLATFELSAAQQRALDSMLERHGVAYEVLVKENIR